MMVMAVSFFMMACEKSVPVSVSMPDVRSAVGTL